MKVKGDDSCDGVVKEDESDDDLVCDICFFFFNDTATTEIYTLSLHDAFPISKQAVNTHGQDGMCDVKGIRVNNLPAINEKVLPGAA